ncbi:MAG: tRNA (adenosine(37)-N6)-threonylcarbamoyltransferase complex ATPase subunit type 1 TsaE [Planctomycetes bacterium]|nr:tRNA (adenosine(37)-N6)-threonylcarbamoyltransferase complex ATPase subunit type 1 TsaE [Planctomycetota bacterium]
MSPTAETMTTLELQSNSADDTLAIGREIGAALPPGLFVALNGELGSGKTVLVKGIAHGLGVPGWAGLRSPTFTLMLSYHGGRCVLHHVDFYRLNEAPGLPGEIEDCMFSSDQICIVEWADIWPETWPKQHLTIHIRAGEDKRRNISIEFPEALLPGLASALEKWTVSPSSA